MKLFNSLIVLGRIGNRVYQRTAPGKGNIPNGGRYDLQNRAYVAHNLSHTAAQITNQNKFRAAVAAWRLLTPAEQKNYRDAASQRGITAYNLFISNWLKTH